MNQLFKKWIFAGGSFRKVPTVMNKLPWQKIVLLALTLGLAACGGGADGASTSPPPPVVPPPVAAPAAPAGVIASAAINTVQLEWRAATGATSYNVYRYGLTPQVFFNTAGLTPTTTGVTKIGSSTTTSFQDNTAALGTDYLYVVTAANSGGESAVSDHSCSAAAPAGASLPPIRPRVFMAAHGSNLVEDPAGKLAPYQDPTPAQIAASSYGLPDLIQSSQTDWAYVATCLDGVWANYALDYPPGTLGFGPNANFTDQVTLYNLLNTRNVLGEEDLVITPAAPLAPTDGRLTGPQNSATAGGNNIVLNREAINIYIPDPTIWDTYTAASANSEYISSTTYPAWSQYKAVYYGSSLQEWVTPAATGQIFSDANSVAAFKGTGGTFMECGTNCGTTHGYVSNPVTHDQSNCGSPSCFPLEFRQGYLNAIIATHLKGDPFVTFYSDPGNSTGAGIMTAGWLAQLKDSYNFVSNMACSGTFDPATGNYYPTGGYWEANGTYTAYPSTETTSGPNVTSWNLCPAGQTKGLWRKDDVVMIISYHGYYRPVPEYATAPTGGNPGVPADSITGMLNWLLHQ